MTIEVLMIIGAVAGILISIVAPNAKLGCAMLMVIPVAMIVYVVIWQNQHPESIRSTSGLDFIFGSLWPSFGGCVGFALGNLLKSLSKNKPEA